MNIQKDIEFLEAAIPELQTYLLSQELYYPLGNQLPRLTLGAVLLGVARLGLRAEPLRVKVEAAQERWRSAWQAKAEREVKARSSLWMQYLEEYRDDSRNGSKLYPQNVRHRAMLTLLGESAHETDALLKSVFVEGAFVWEKEIAENFPREPFWYLFGTLKE